MENMKLTACAVRECHFRFLISCQSCKKKKKHIKDENNRLELVGSTIVMA